MNCDIYHYNDYELLYLIHQNSDEAREILLWKYSFLIKNRIKQFNINPSYYDDFYQEGLITLLESVRIFDEYSPMRFTNFFDLVLKRRFLNLIKKESQFQNTIKKDNFEELLDLSRPIFERLAILNEIEEVAKRCDFSDFEREIFELYYIDNWTINDICKTYNYVSKNVSNAKQRIIRKMKHSAYK